MNQLKYSWVTVNRQCNLRCQWCYAGSAEFKKSLTMPLTLLKDIVSFIAKIGIQNISLTGGEPTCHPQIREIVSYVHSQGLNPILITNGVALANRTFLNSLYSQGLSGINLSLKGGSEKDYEKNTGVEAYEKTLRAISNVAATNIDFVVSMVLSCNNIDMYLSAVRDAVSCGAKRFHFSFEHDFSVLDGNEKKYDIQNVFRLIDGFQNSYGMLSDITKGCFTLHQSLPVCIWDKNLIRRLGEYDQIVTSCHLLERSGLVFDTDGSLIPCNLMHQISLAKYGEDFCDKDSFFAFWNAPKTQKMYQAFCSYPGKRCSHCDVKMHCGGGCVSNWYHYSYDELTECAQRLNITNK